MRKKDTKVIGRRKKEHFGGIMDLFAVKIRKKANNRVVKKN